MTVKRQTFECDLCSCTAAAEAKSPMLQPYIFSSCSGSKSNAAERITYLSSLLLCILWSEPSRVSVPPLQLWHPETSNSDNLTQRCDRGRSGLDVCHGGRILQISSFCIGWIRGVLCDVDMVASGMISTNRLIFSESDNFGVVAELQVVAVNLSRWIIQSLRLKNSRYFLPKTFGNRIVSATSSCTLLKHLRS